MSVSYREAIYAGSFDPPTNGHLYIIRRAASLFSRVVIALGHNPGKQPAFSTEERLEMLWELARGVGRHVEVAELGNRYLVHFAQERGCGVIVRGIRSFIDYDFEHRMRHVNADIAEEVFSVFLMPPRELAEVSSSFVKGLIGPAGWEELVSKLVPAAVFAGLVRRYGSAGGGAGPVLERE